MAHILPEADHIEVAACVCGHDEQRRETLLEALSAWTPLAGEPENVWIDLVCCSQITNSNCMFGVHGFRGIKHSCTAYEGNLQGKKCRVMNLGCVVC